jgi:hypothetical protein
MKKRPSLVLALATTLISLAAAACEKHETVDGQLGELGKVEFTYQRSCFFGCLIEQPLLVGTREAIQVTGPGNDPKIEVRSDEEEVLSVAMERQCYCERQDTTGRLDVAIDGSCQQPWSMTCENRIQVGAHRPGYAKIELLRGNTLIDRVTAYVKEASRARFFGTLPDALGETDDDNFELSVGSQLELRVELYDEDGLELLAPEGVAWRVSDPEVATLQALLVGAGEEVQAGREITLKTHAEGETTVEVDVPGLTAMIDVEVRD